jgi:hypothetical protein
MTDARFDGLARESLITSIPAANFDGVVREVLVTTPTTTYFSSVVREVLAQFPAINNLTLGATEGIDQATFTINAVPATNMTLGATEGRDMAMFTIVNAASVPPWVFPTLPVYRPVSIRNKLTDEVWGYNSIHDVLDGNAVFDFTDWVVSLYEVRNSSDGPLPVRVGGITYSVPVGSVWTFCVHPEINKSYGVPHAEP